jgi:tRNA(Arg) A34 adenosine deaminase TadA
MPVSKKMKHHKLLATCYDKRGKVLSVGENSYTHSHPLQAYFARKVGHHHKIYLHAEIAAILKARDKRIHKIHIERYDKQGNPMLAKPCPICEEAIRTFCISIISYTTGV